MKTYPCNMFEKTDKKVVKTLARCQFQLSEIPKYNFYCQ